jgi:L-fucose isomerase-like protein
MRIMEKKPTFGLIVGTRGFFNPQLAAEGRKQLLSRLDELGYGYVIPAEDTTPNGAIETLADARVAAELFKRNEDKIDGIIVTLPNFGDELGVVQTIDLAKLDVPILVHAFDDDLDKLDFAHRRDAFCGKFSVCNNFYQYDIPFTNYADDRDKCINTHCSNYPKSFIGTDVEIANLDILGETLGADRCFGAVKGQVAGGPMTFFRVSTDDPQGIIKCYLGEGEFTDDPVSIQGGAAVCQVPNCRSCWTLYARTGSSITSP